MGERLPVFDVDDISLSGWEIGRLPDGDVVIQTGECGTHNALRLPRGAGIVHREDGTVEATGVTFYGPKPFTGHCDDCGSQ
jgi:hypothetical protein